MYFRVFQVVVVFLFFSRLAFAIDPVYQGEDGIKAKVFATNCLFCHASNLVGGQRNGAPENVNFDTFVAAKAKADRAIVRAVQLMNMPPNFNNSLDQEQKNALLAWQQAGFPQYPTHASYDFQTLVLTLPVVHVGDLKYRATLGLVARPDSEIGFGFELLTADIIDDTSATAATYDLASGVVTMPEVDFQNGDDAGQLSAKMLLEAGSVPLSFVLTEVVFK